MFPLHFHSGFYCNLSHVATPSSQRGTSGDNIGGSKLFIDLHRNITDRLRRFGWLDRPWTRIRIADFLSFEFGMLGRRDIVKVEVQKPTHHVLLSMKSLFFLNFSTSDG